MTPVERRAWLAAMAPIDQLLARNKALADGLVNLTDSARYRLFTPMEREAWDAALQALADNKRELRDVHNFPPQETR